MKVIPVNMIQQQMLLKKENDKIYNKVEKEKEKPKVTFDDLFQVELERIEKEG